ncbi:MAG: substrate-binding domain-containing protein [Bacteroidales bacterium]|nr:substrate-binding domain-containing protein [Bacteroidales bacterium]MDT8431380.1 substrate-binding domain-containing protein [Bacteroidales bacterium]
MSDHIPLYKKITAYYSRRIYQQDYPPGGPIDSIHKIMERHLVSRETAKLVHKKLVDKGLVVAVQGKGTFVNIRPVREKIWGVVVPFFSSNIEQLIALLSEAASSAHCKLKYFLHYNNPDEEIRITSEMILAGYEAIIVVPNYDESRTADYYRRIVTGRSKLVLADNTMAGSYFNYVIQSYDLGVKRAFDYLVSQQDGNFLLMGTETWKGQHLVFELMENTLRMLIQEKVPERKLFVRNDVQQIEQGYIRSNRIGCILSLQDIEAVKILGRLRHWEFKIPQEISLVSYGNTELTEFFQPAITVIDCNYRKMAESIAAHITGTAIEKNRQIVISPEIIVRAT